MGETHRRRMIVLVALLGLATGNLVPPHFTVDLDKPPSERWRGSVSAVLDAHPFEYSFGPVFAAHNASLFSKLSRQQWALLGESVRKNHPENAAEIMSISAEFATHGYAVSFEYLAAWVW